jgi:hypothetical protein
MNPVVVAAVIAAAFVTAVVFGFRWTRPTANNTMRRADEAQSGGTLDPKSVRDRIRTYLTIYGPKT